LPGGGLSQKRDTLYIRRLAVKVRLGVTERIKLSELLESETGSYARLEMINDFRGALSLSEEEQKLIQYYEMRAPDGRTYSGWKYPEKDPNKEFDIGEILLEMICRKLQALEQANPPQLKQDQRTLYKAFKAEVDKLKEPAAT
jgi:hypothetical protein